jgi:hypothetical protein
MSLLLSSATLNSLPGCGGFSASPAASHMLPGGEDLGPPDLAAEAQGYSETVRLKLKSEYQPALSSLQFTATEKGGDRQCLITGAASKAVRREIESILLQFYPQLQIVWR